MGSSHAYIALSQCRFCGKVHRHIFKYPSGEFELWNMQECPCPPDENGKKFEMLDGFLTLDDWLDKKRNELLSWAK